MGFSWPTGQFNVAGSFNKWFGTQINLSVPSWQGGTFRVLFNYPDEPLFDAAAGLTAAAFSVTHLGAFEETLSQGDLVDGGKRGQRMHGIVDVSAWVYAKDNYNWPMQLSQMRDMVVKLCSGTRTVVVNDVYGSTTAPAASGYVLRIERVEEQETLPDPNPNVKRRRMLVYISYVQRQ